MNVVLFEPNAHGHRFAHIRRLAPSVAQLGVKLTLVTSSESLATNEFKEQIKPIADCFTIESSRSYPIAKPNYLRAAAEGLLWTARTLRPDHLLVPYADGTMQIAGTRRLLGMFRVPGGVELEGLMMRGEFAYARNVGLRARLRHEAWLTATAAAPFRTLHHMDPYIAEALGKRRASLRPKMHLISDPVEAFGPMSREEARASLGIPTDGRYIGCVGYQDTRKGIHLLVRAFLRANLPKDYRLLLAGRMDPELKVVIDREDVQQAVRDRRVVLLNRYISDPEFLRGIAAMDVVATPYPASGGHVGSSSIVIHAASQGKPVLGSDFGWVGNTIRRFGLGHTCDVDDPEVFARTIGASLEASAAFTPIEAGRRFVEFHRPENFVNSFLVRLRERLGVTQPPALRPWSWVLDVARA